MECNYTLEHKCGVVGMLIHRVVRYGKESQDVIEEKIHIRKTVNMNGYGDCVIYHSDSLANYTIKCATCNTYVVF